MEKLAEHADALRETWTVDLNPLSEIADSVDLDAYLPESAFKALSQLPCRIVLAGAWINESQASRLAKCEASALDLRNGCNLESEDAARRLMDFTGAILVRMNSLDEPIRQVLRAHSSLSDWGKWTGPYVEIVCKNCGDHRQLEFPDNEATIYSVFGDGPGPWAICPECREELSEEELTALED
jgi:hypothetical protein